MGDYHIKYGVTYKEYRIYKEMSHYGIAPNIITYDPSQRKLITEYAGIRIEDIKDRHRYRNQIIDKIKKMHNHGVFHLDISGANILIDKYEKVWIIDFGLSIWKSEWTQNLGPEYYDEYADTSEELAQLELDEIDICIVRLNHEKHHDLMSELSITSYSD
jgi:serine/threonine protein kinase